MAGKIKIHSKNNKIIIACQKNIKINTREIEVLKKNAIQELIVPTVSMAGNKIKLFYDLTGYVPIVDAIGNSVKKKEFIKTVMALPVLLDKLETQYMQKNNLILDMKYVFFNLKTGMMKYIYLPLIHLDKNDETIDFLKRLPYYTVFAPSENVDYVSEYIRFFRDNITFSMYDFKEMVQKISARGTQGNISRKSNDDTGRKKYANLLDLITGEKIVISKDKYIVGKNEDCDLFINSSHVSRQHAYILYTEGAYYLVDMGSTNKTFIDDVPVIKGIPTELHNGMQIKFADRPYRFFLAVKGAVD